MFWVILVIVGLVIIAIFNKKEVIPPAPPPNPPEPVPDPDPHYWKWQLVDKTTERWKNYSDYMKRVTSDTLVALEMKFYKWVSDWDLFHKLDYWDLPDEVWKNKKADCDGLARLSGDMLGRFAKIPEVWWLEYYGFYRYYFYNKEKDKWDYEVKAAGHAITVYKKDGKLLAFSNTSWWNKLNFKDFIEIGEQTFPEGLYWVICRHWETGEMEWHMKAKQGEIIERTNIFERKLKLIKKIKRLKRGEQKKIKEMI
ncbi:MAG: hypothetical protein ACTSPI_14030 [Candidatus Heimdallarchaeaceae archaeon]